MFHWNRSSGSGGRIQRRGRGNREWQDDGEPHWGRHGGRTESGTDRGCRRHAECPPGWSSGYLMSLSSAGPSVLPCSQQMLTTATLDWPRSDLLFSMPCRFRPQWLIGWIFGREAAHQTRAAHQKSQSCLKTPSLSVNISIFLTSAVEHHPFPSFTPSPAPCNLRGNMVVEKKNIPQ